MDMIKTAIARLELPHWLILAGAMLVLIGLIGLVISRRRGIEAEGEPAAETSPEPRPELTSLPDLLDSRPRKGRQSR